MDIGPGSIIAGRFRLERPLSRGGMGSVWIARHVELGSAVAVKFMDARIAASPVFRARFEREARAAANLETPHVVHVQDYGVDGGVPYLVMELLQGEDLGARLDRMGRTSLQEAAWVLAQAGRALRRAHEAGLVHRDLKPRNLFLARVEDEEIVKVLDFGIVKETAARRVEEITDTGEVIGSPLYMSPEQVRGAKDLDARSDLWSLGVIVFRALTGEVPFTGDEVGEVMGKILVDPIPEATRLAPDLPPSVDGFFAKALARDRALRFQTVREMVDDLARIAGTSPAPSSVSGAVVLAGRAAVGTSVAPAAEGAVDRGVREGGDPTYADKTAPLPPGFGTPTAPLPPESGAGTTTLRRRRARTARTLVIAAVVIAAGAALTLLRRAGPVAEASDPPVDAPGGSADEPRDAPEPPSAIAAPPPREAVAPDPTPRAPEGATAGERREGPPAAREGDRSRPAPAAAALPDGSEPKAPAQAKGHEATRPGAPPRATKAPPGAKSWGF